jgi:hypothetical protein
MTGRESGKGNVGLIIFLLVVAFGIFVLVKYIPPRINAMQFRDEMTRINTDPDYRMRRLNSEQVVDILYKKAQELKLPIEKSQIGVSKDNERFKISVSFQIPVDITITTIKQKYDFTEPRDL